MVRGSKSADGNRRIPAGNGYQMKTLTRECAACDRCVKECAFLKRYGNPGVIAGNYLTGPPDERIWFECSLCGLCTSVCPKDLNPSKAFLDMRRRVFEAKGKVRPEHKGILAYEKKGLSRRYTLYKLPKGCSAVFFPGCTFAGTRAKRTQEVFTWL